MASATPRFAAFISYNRQVDTTLAKSLQLALHRFAKPWYKLRAVRVFRDDSSLTANPGLWSSVRQALDNSEFLILLASPQAAQSQWVDKEVRHWLATKPAANILIALTSGELAWDRTTNDFDWERTTSLPPLLRGVFSEEPRYVDLRVAQQLPDPAHSRVFRDLVADLAAPLHHRPKDEMAGEDVRAHRVTRMVTAGAITALALLAVTATVFAIDSRAQTRVAEAQQRLATARSLAFQAQSLRDTQPATALRLGIAAEVMGSSADTRRSLIDSLLSNKAVGSIGPLAGPARMLSLNGEGTMLLADAGGQVVLTDLADPVNPRQVSTLTAPGNQPSAGRRIAAIALSPSTPAAFVSYDDGAGLLWNVTDPAKPVVAGQLKVPGEGPAQAAFSEDGRKLLTGSGSSIGFWDISNVAAPRLAAERATPYSTYVNFLAFRSGDKMVFAGEADGGAIAWDVSALANPREVSRFGGWKVGAGDSVPPHAVAVSHNARYAIAGDETGLPTVWELSDPTKPKVRFRLSDSTLSGAEFSRDSRRLIVTAYNDTTSVWDIRPASEFGGLEGFEELKDRDYWLKGDGFTSQSGLIESIALAGGRNLALAGTDNGTIVIWRLQVPARLPLLAAPSSGNVADDLSVVLSPDARLALAGQKLWDLSDPQKPRQPAHLDFDIVTAAFSPDGRLLLAASEEKSVLFDMSTPGKPLQIGTLKPLPYTQQASMASGASAFRGDGKQLAVIGDDGKLIIWDTSDPAKPRMTAEIATGLANGPSLAYSPKGFLMVTGNGRDTTTVWDPGRPGQPLAEIAEAGNAILAHGFNGEQALALIGGGESATLWDLTDIESPSKLGLIPGQGGRITAAAFSSDTRTLLVSSSEIAGVLWDISDGRNPHRLASFSGLASEASYTAQAGRITGGAAALFPQGGQVALTGGGAGDLAIWDLKRYTSITTDPVKEACAIAGRGLTADEWETFVPGLPYQPTCASP